MARMRSPNFPGLPLDAAVRAVAEIYDKNRRAVIMREDAAKDLGYSGLTGRSLKILGALNQYDLIENVSKGQVRVSKTAEEILHGIPDEVKVHALHKAGNAPSLFQAIFERFEGGVPGENAVRSFLFQKGFTNEGVEKALRNFMETNRHLEIAGAIESHRDEPQSKQESPPVQSKREEESREMGGAAAAAESGGGSLKVFRGGALDFSLSSSGLSLTGKTNSASELKAFIERLKVLAVVLPDAPKEEPNGEADE
jgi:hypothetical protein